MERKITQKAIAKKLRLGESAISEMLSGKYRVSSKTALRLERKTGINIRVWLNGSKTEIRSELESFFGGKINFSVGRPKKLQEQPK